MHQIGPAADQNLNFRPMIEVPFVPSGLPASLLLIRKEELVKECVCVCVCDINMSVQVRGSTVQLWAGPPCVHSV